MKVKTFTATFVVDGKTIRFAKVRADRAAVHRKGGCTLAVTTGRYTGLRLRRADGRAFELKSATYDIGFPLTNAGKIIVPDTGRHFMETVYPRKVMFKQNYYVSSAHMSTPFFCYLDGVERVTLAFGLMGKIIDTVFTQVSPGANRKFSLVVRANECRWRIRKPYHEKASLGLMKEWRDGFYQSEGEKTWWHALRAYATLWQKEHKVETRTHPAAYEPEFCTWRVVNSDRLTHDWTVATARECAGMGLGVMILDDGWFGVGLDSEIMRSDIGDWPRRIPGKYPDIAKTVRAIRKEGVRPLLWYCPTGVGCQSKLLPSVKDCLIVNEGRPYETPGLFHTLCPRNPRARRIMVENLRKVLAYGPDGYKPDLFNYMPTAPCEADHEHDIPTALEATKVCFEMMYREALKHGRGLVFMAKNDEANVDFCQYAPAVRAGDSPYDPNIMVLRCAYPAAFAPTIINDYLMLAGPETTEEIARCMIKQVTMGVPALSVDLLRTPRRQKEALAAWIRLYNEQLKPIHMRARLEPQDPTLSCWERVDREARVGVIGCFHPCSMIEEVPDVDRLFVLNATAHDALPARRCRWRGKAAARLFDAVHRRVGEQEWRPGHPIPAPASGYAEMRKP